MKVHNFSPSSTMHVLHYQFFFGGLQMFSKHQKKNCKEENARRKGKGL
jgi:hypothetical protein